MKQLDREAILKWQAYKANLMRATAVPKESYDEQQKRIKRLKGNFEEYCQYYFPNYCSAPFAKFHKDFAKKVIENKTIYIVRAWAREHAKSAIAGLFLPFYLKFAENEKLNMLLVSKSWDNAADLIMPIMANLECNQRIINDFGVQVGFGSWERGKFTTSDGSTFIAKGAGQSPRGSKNEEVRPNYVLVDDIDDDDEIKNQNRINEKYKWVEGALFPTMSLNKTKRFIVVGNIISRESVVVKASRVADDFQQINILDKNNEPSWKENYTIEQVNYMLSKMSYAAGQREYFNNPITEGTVFKEMSYKKLPTLDKYTFLVAYTDPSFKDTKKNDYKATILMGKYKNEYHIIKAFLQQTNVGVMVSWWKFLHEYVSGKCPVYFYIESNATQDIIEQQCRNLIFENNYPFSLFPDLRAKGDKFSRIESALEPINRNGQLWLNIDEKDNEHMKRLDEQFVALAPGSSTHDDGPDAVEGGKFIIDQKTASLQPILLGNRKLSIKSKHKF